MVSPTQKLVKGKQPKTQEPAPEPATEAEEDEVVDINKASGPQMDSFVKDNKIKIEGWAKMLVRDKRVALTDYLLAQQEAEVEEAAPEPEPEPEPAKPAKAAKAPKATKAAKKTPAKAAKEAKEPASQEVLDADIVSTAAQEIDAMDAETAESEVKRLLEETAYNAFRIGGMLQRIQVSGEFESGKKFVDYVMDEFGIHSRRAYNFIEIYNMLVNEGIPWEKVAPLGWSKLAKLPGLLTAKNANAMVKKLKDQSVRSIEVWAREEKKRQQAGEGAGDGEAGTSEVIQVKTKGFRLQPDQMAVVEEALEVARAKGDTDYDGVALTYMCHEFIGAPGNKKKVVQTYDPTEKGITKALKAIIADIGKDETLKRYLGVLDETFDEYDFVVKAAGAEAA